MGAPTGAATTPFSGWPVCISNHPSINGHHLLSHGKSHRNGVSRPRKKIRLSNNKNTLPTLRKGNKNSQHPLKEEFKWKKKNHPPHTTGKRSEVPFFGRGLARIDTTVTIFVPSFSIIKLCKLWILRHGSLCPIQTHTHTYTHTRRHTVGFNSCNGAPRYFRVIEQREGNTRALEFENTPIRKG